MLSLIDIVTVFYSQKSFEESQRLLAGIQLFEKTEEFNFVAVDNSKENRGFAKACNLGVEGSASPFLGFLNPDAEVKGSFIHEVVRALRLPTVKVTGCSFGKSRDVCALWGLSNWVCGAAFFTTREWFSELGGFDERFIWSYEETDFCRRTEEKGFHVKPIALPIEHEDRDPNKDPSPIREYKLHHLKQSGSLYAKKWPQK